jgi:KTSC domain
VDMIPVRSTSLAAVSYDSERWVLTVAFRNGALYEYHGVPKAVYEALMRARSKGKFFLEYIRESYEPKALRSRSDSQG